MKDYLPIGTVVMLKGGNRAIMIYGYRVRRENEEKEYDYVACLFPEGFLSADYTYLFNQEQIDKVIYRGLSNAEQEAYIKRLNTF